MTTRWTQADIDAIQARSRQLVKLMPGCLVPKAKPAKYHNVKVVDATGAVHDSGKEFRRWQELRLREIAGEIRNLRRHVRYSLDVYGVHICSYEADAVYEEGAATIVEDTKSEPTRKRRDYIHKKRLMQAIHKIQIHEV